MTHSKFQFRIGAASPLLKPSNFRHRGGGFTLIECLLAAVVLALFGAAMTSSISQALNANSQARNERFAATYLDEVLARIDAIGPSTIAATGPFDGAIGDFTWAADIEQQPDSDLYAVTVTVTWKTATGSRSVKAYTLLHDAIGSRSYTLTWEDLS